MVITIKKIYNDNYVEVSSPYGTFCGKYVGENICTDHMCDVEIDIPNVFALDDFEISDTQSFNIVTSNGITTINGLVQEIDADIIFVRFGLDLIAIKIILDVEYQSLLNKYVSFSFVKIVLYDTWVI